MAKYVKLALSFWDGIAAFESIKVVSYNRSLLTPPLTRPVYFD